MSLVYAPQDLIDLLVRVVGIDRALTAGLTDQVADVVGQELAKPERCGFTVLQRPTEGLVSVLLAADFGLALPVPSSDLHSPCIEADMASVSTGLVEGMRQHYASIEVRH